MKSGPRGVAMGKPGQAPSKILCRVLRGKKDAANSGGKMLAEAKGLGAGWNNCKTDMN